MLPWKDSNPHRRNQNPTCYHYTTRQNCECKVKQNIRCFCHFCQVNIINLTFLAKTLFAPKRYVVYFCTNLLTNNTLMFIASQKRKENISEYLLYMWQVEDLIRANGLDIDRITTNVIDRFGLLEEQRKQMIEWYESLIDMMRRENISEKGHLQLNKNTIIQLAQLHDAVLKEPRFTEYSAEYYKTLPFIVELRAKAGENKQGELETCFTALYGTLLLRLQGKEITKDTQSALTQISRFIALLSHYFNLDSQNKLFKED